MRTVYLDHGATTPAHPKVVEAMMPYFTAKFGNPSNLHDVGREAKNAVEAARAQTAALVGAKPEEVFFTSSGTESNNFAIKGLAQANSQKGNHIIVSQVEHFSVLHPVKSLEKAGFKVTQIAPDKQGLIDPADIAKAVTKETVLVSIMHANNEIGTINPIKELASVAHEGGALFHTDAAQTLGKIPFDVQDLGVDLASFSSHKIYGPKGFGALYLKKRTPFVPLQRGGGQEFKKRSGTQNTPGAAGFAKAIELMLEDQAAEMVRLSGLRDKLVNGVLGALENTQCTTDVEPRLPHIASLLINGVEGEAMLLQLDNKGIAVSTGSACSSGSLEPSHVLLSIGLAPEIAHGSLRVTVGRYTTEEDVDYLLEVLPPIIERLRAMSPVYAKMFCSTDTTTA